MSILRVEMETVAGWSGVSDDVRGAHIEYGFGRDSKCVLETGRSDLSDATVRVTVVCNDVEYPRFTGVPQVA